MRIKLKYLLLCVGTFSVTLYYICYAFLQRGRMKTEATKIIKPKDYYQQISEVTAKPEQYEKPLLDLSRWNKIDADKTIIWAVLGNSNNPSLLDLFLKSIKDLGVIMYVRNTKNSQLDEILLKHHVNPYKNPYDCTESRRPKSENSKNVGCRKNEWLWLMRHAWDSNPDIVCFTFDDLVIHPDANVLIWAHAPDDVNGVKLSSKQTLYPWCFGPKVWSRLESSINDYCDMENDSWEKTIVSMLSNNTQNEVMFITSELSMTFDTCRKDKCTEKPMRNLQRRVKSWFEENRVYLDGVQSAPFIPPKTLSSGHTTWSEHVKCRGNVCEGYQFKPASDERIYYNRVLDGKGETAYIIDLGATCIDMSKVHVSFGGENVADVLGREEQVEFPRYDFGAFQVANTPPSFQGFLYQRKVLRSANATGKQLQTFDFTGTTIAYQRNDYANICFVISDFFNLFLTLQHVPSERMLWLDGHALGNFDNITTELFNMDLLRLGHISGLKCFERLVLMPRKYTLYYVPKFGGCENTVEDFVAKMKKQYNITASTQKHDTVIVRDYYLAHPRVGKEVTRKFSNEDVKNIKKKLPGVRFVKFQNLSWRKQLQIVANTKTLYGMHGAGLTLGLFLEKGSKLVEWMHESRTGTLTFEHFMSWRADVEFERLFLKDWLLRRT